MFLFKEFEKITKAQKHKHNHILIHDAKKLAKDKPIHIQFLIFDAVLTKLKIDHFSGSVSELFALNQKYKETKKELFSHSRDLGTPSLKFWDDFVYILVRYGRFKTRHHNLTRTTKH